MKTLFLITLLATVFNVSNVEEFNKAAKKVQAGDQIVLASGVWQDAVLKLRNVQGTAEAPITVTVAEPTKTILSGSSSIRFSGEYVVIDGLIFEDLTPSESEKSKMVIEFKSSSTDYANNSVVRRCEVRNFNPADKAFQTTWVSIWGKNNTVEYCHLVGKANQGTTLIVWPNDSASIENHHRIHHNYFGYRRPLGSNGGETIRIGTSHVCKNNSQTQVDNNFFEQCSGEVEIISIKSCENIVRNNTFFECEGSVVLRHGDRNIVEDNVFIGNNKHHTGGVRIVNADHKVSGNTFHRLAGEEFRAALCLMNGIPNSAPNGYERVQNVTIDHNTWIDCARPMEFCMGKGSRDRDDQPINTTISDNMIYLQPKTPLITEHDKGYDIRLVGNTVVEQQAAPAAAENKKQKVDTIYYEAGVTVLTKTIKVTRDMVVIGRPKPAAKKQKAVPATLTMEKENGAARFFEIVGDANLTIKDLTIVGDTYTPNPAKYCIQANKEHAQNFVLRIDNCDISGFNVEGGAVYKATPGSFADTICVTNTSIHDCYRGFGLAEEKDEKGHYNAEVVRFDKVRFNRIGQWVINYTRLGNDESTTGGSLIMTGCSFNNMVSERQKDYIKVKGIKNVQL